MIEVTTIGSHAGSQALGKVYHCFIHVFLWQLFPDGLQSDFQLIIHLVLQLEFMVLCEHGNPDVVSNLEGLRANGSFQWTLDSSLAATWMTCAMWAEAPCWLPMLVAWSIWSVHFQVCILTSAPPNWLFFRTTHILPEKMSEMLKSSNWFFPR